MNFEWTDTQRLLRESAERLARDAFDFQARRHLFLEDAAAIREQWEEIAALGICGVLVPDEFGGMGGTLHDLAPVLEAWGGAMVIEPVAATAVVGAGLIAAAASEARKAELLPRIANGSLRFALATAERQSRYRLDDVETRLAVVGDELVLDGAKTLAFGGATADLFAVTARNADDEGLSLVLVPRDAPGLEVTAYRNLDLGGAADLRFDGVRIGRGDLLGARGEALPLVEQAADRGAAALCIEAVGAMQALNDLTLDHLRTRHAFGSPLGGFQVLQHRIVDMIVACEQARSMAMLAADAADCADPAERARDISAAKVQVGRSARFIGEQAMQLHGAVAITLEHPVGYFHKRLAVIDHLFGDIEHHLERFADASGY